MKKIWKNILKIIGYEEIFTVAYRKSNGSGIMEGKDKFLLIPYAKEYWYADPILFEKDGVTYIFMEVYDRKERKGKIGFVKETEQGWTKPQIIINENFHMSFPFIFEKNGEIFMIPETSASDKLFIYQCESFPEKWKPIKKYNKMGSYVDTILIESDNKDIFLSCEMNPNNLFETSLHTFCIENNALIEKYKQGTYSYDVRNGGALCYKDGEKIRVSQVSGRGEYGIGLKFWKLSSIYPELKEECFKIVQVKDIICEQNCIGIHTYGCSSKYEVIDVKLFVFNPFKWIWRINNLIRR